MYNVTIWYKGHGDRYPIGCIIFDYIELHY